MHGGDENVTVSNSGAIVSYVNTTASLHRLATSQMEVQRRPVHYSSLIFFGRNSEFRTALQYKDTQENVILSKYGEI